MRDIKRIRQTLLSAICFAAGMGLQACGDHASVASPVQTLQDPVIAFQEADLVVGAVVFVCGRWSADQSPGGDYMIADVLFDGGYTMTGPSAADVQAIEKHGGVVLHHYNVRAARARLPIESIPSLYWSYSDVNHFRWVPGPDRHDLEVSVGYSGPLAPVREEFETLGGHIQRVYDDHDTFVAFLPDSAVPRLRSRDDVRWLKHETFWCLAG